MVKGEGERGKREEEKNLKEIIVIQCSVPSLLA